MEAPFKISWREITPELAKEWLTTRNKNNRALRADTAASFARDMLAGEWIPNHQGIAFGDSGNLIDGQHRLAAIVKSGISHYMLVCEDVPERPPGKRLATIGSIDRGAARSIADILKLEHNLNKHQAFAAALVTSIVMLSLRDTRRVRKCSISQCLAVLAIFPEDARWIIDKRPPLKAFNNVNVLAPFAWARPLAPAKVEAMLDKFIKGTGLSDGDPMLGLRNYVIAGTSKKDVDGRELRLRTMEVVLHCIWHGIHDKRLGEIHGAGANQAGQVTWFREKRRDFTDKIEAIFPVISLGKIEVPKPSPILRVLPKKKAPKSLPPKPPEPQPVRNERPGLMSDGRTRKELLREIARRVN